MRDIRLIAPSLGLGSLAAAASPIRTTKAEKVAIATIAAGAVTTVVGAVIYARAARRRTTALRDTLGRVEARVRSGGMLLTHHYDPEMPIEQRVHILQDLVWKGVKNPEMRELALAITGRGDREVTVGKRKFRVRGANCPARDGLCEAEAIYNWTKNNVRYTGDVAPVVMPGGDVEGVDLFQGSWRTAQFGGGDCDDHSVINATLLALNGIPSKFRITAPSKSSDWAHIYNLAGLPKTRPGKWVPIDSTLPGNMFGREAPSGKQRDFMA